MKKLKLNGGSWRPGLVLAGLWLSSLVLSGCAQTPPLTPADETLTSGPEWACVVFKPIHAKASDDAQTLEEVRQHNLVWDDLCG